MNSVWSNILSLRYQVIAQTGCKDTGVRNLEFVAKTQFLSKNNSFKSKVYSKIFLKISSFLRKKCLKF